MTKTFEEVYAEFQETDEYKDDSFHWDKAAKIFFNAGLLAAVEIMENSLNNEPLTYEDVDGCGNYDDYYEAGRNDGIKDSSEAIRKITKEATS